MAIVTDTWEAAVENYDCVYQIGPPLLKSSLSYILPKSKLEIKSGSLSLSDFLELDFRKRSLFYLVYLFFKTLAT